MLPVEANMNTEEEKSVAFEDPLLQTVRACANKKDRLRHRLNEFESELEDLHQEAHFHRQKAQRLEEEGRLKYKEVKELRKEYEASLKSHIKLEFESQCLVICEM
jgi:predicted nuclease with TOPRIM domain